MPGMMRVTLTHMCAHAHGPLDQLVWVRTCRPATLTGPSLHCSTLGLTLLVVPTTLLDRAHTRNTGF